MGEEVGEKGRVGEDSLDDDYQGGAEFNNDCDNSSGERFFFF